VCVLKTNRLIFCEDKIAGCSEIHKKFSSALSKQKAKFVRVKFGGSFSNHYPTKEFMHECSLQFICMAIKKSIFFTHDVCNPDDRNELKFEGTNSEPRQGIGL